MAFKKDNKTMQLQGRFLIELITEEGQVTPALSKARIGLEQHIEWMQEDAWYREQITNIRIELVEDALVKSAVAGNTKAQMYFLDTFGKSRGYGFQEQDAETKVLERDNPIYTVMENLDKFFVPGVEAIPKKKQKQLPKFLDEL